LRISKQKHLTPKQYKQLLNWLDDQPNDPWIDAVKVLARTGCRSQELLNLRLEHIDTVNSAVAIPAVKGSNCRIMPLSRNMLKTLWDALESTNGFTQYLGFDNEQSALRELRRQFKLILFRALGYGFSHLGPHSARASFAVNIYLSLDKDILLVKELLGHKAIGSTLVYVDMSRSMEKAKPIVKAIG